MLHVLRVGGATGMGVGPKEWVGPKQVFRQMELLSIWVSFQQAHTILCIPTDKESPVKPLPGCNTGAVWSIS